MRLTPTEALFAMSMLGAAILAALVAHHAPGARHFVVPPFSWPLFAALLFDLATLPLIRRERMAPLRHEVRVIGVIAAAILVVAISSAGGSSAPA